VKDLLLFARPPKPHPTPVDVTPLLVATADLVRAEPGHGDLSVQITGSAPLVMADPELLKIVFINLLLNSAHAVRGTGTIVATIGVEGAMCHIAITDHGPGIAPEIMDQLFTPFVTTKSRGTGLGLSTVKRLVDAHGGRIRASCPPDGGTTMTLWLPLA
jgi:signal transduction histidine kinase